MNVTRMCADFVQLTAQECYILLELQVLFIVITCEYYSAFLRVCLHACSRAHALSTVTRY